MKVLFKNEACGFLALNILANMIFLCGASAQAINPPPPVTLPAPLIIGIEIVGPAAVPEESRGLYGCMASFSDGSRKRVSADWSSITPFATILAYGALSTDSVDSDQAVVITASYGGLRANLTVVIENIPPVLTGIEIMGKAEVPEESRGLYACMANFSDGSRKRVSPIWEAETPFASMLPYGALITDSVESDQTTVITANFEGFTARFDAIIKNSLPTVTNIEIVGPAEVPEESRGLYGCIARYSDGSSKRVTAEWAAESAFASLLKYGALITGSVESDQTVVIRANYEGFTAQFDAIIKNALPELTGIEIVGPAEVQEESRGLYGCMAYYSDGSRKRVTAEWNAETAFASMQESGVLTSGPVNSDQTVVISANYEGFSADFSVTILSSEEVIFPLTGFEGKQLDAYLYDETAQEYISLGEMYEPDELVIRNLDPSHLYWLRIRMYDEETDQWPLIHESSIEYKSELITK